METSDRVFKRKYYISKPFGSSIIVFLFSFLVVLIPILLVSTHNKKVEEDISQKIKKYESNEEGKIVLAYLGKRSESTVTMMIVINFISSSMAALLYYRIRMQQRENEQESRIKQTELDKLINLEKEKNAFKDKQDEISFRLQLAHSNSQNLKNTISGVNHEVAPWLGIIRNVANMLSTYMDIKKNLDTENAKFVQGKICEIEKAAEQCIGIVENLSKNIKYLQRYDITKTNVGETIKAMVSTALLNSSIRKNIRPAQIKLDEESLNFDCVHSPMFLQQILLNLVNNAIDHNETMKDTLEIKIYGDLKEKSIHVYDTGKGIPECELPLLFTPNFTTKDDVNVPHGLGLSMSMDYAISMGAYIKVESELDKYTQFTIQFEVPDIETKKGTVSDIYKALNDEDSDYGKPRFHINRKESTDS